MMWVFGCKGRGWNTWFSVVILWRFVLEWIC